MPSRAVILAGGVRSGLELGQPALPRALWPFPADPLITHVIRFLLAHHIQHIAICANGKTKLIASELSATDSPWSNLHYSEDAFPRGPAGCLKDLESWLGSEPFIALQGTASYDFDLPAMFDAHNRSHAAITVGATASRSPSGCETLEPAGVYILSPAILAHINSVGYQDIKEQLLPKAMNAGLPVRCHRIAGRVDLIHSPRHYLHALDALLSSSAFPVADMLQPRPHIYIHPTATVAHDARITGPAWIDRHVRIDSGALLLGPAIIGPNVHIGAKAILNRVVAMRDSRIAPAADITHAVLPPSTVIAAPRPQPARRAALNPRPESSWLSPARSAMTALLMRRGQAR